MGTETVRFRRMKLLNDFFVDLIALMPTATVQLRRVNWKRRQNALVSDSGGVVRVKETPAGGGRRVSDLLWMTPKV